MIESLWHWIQENSSGLGVILSLLGVLLSLLGFFLLWLQTRKIRNVTEASALATGKALKAIFDTDTISDLASIRERIKKVQVAMQGSRFETALHETQSLRESLHQLRNRSGFGTDESKIEIQEMVTFLRKIQDYFERHFEDAAYQVPVRTVNNKLADHATKVSEWIEKMRVIRGENNQ